MFENESDITVELQNTINQFASTGGGEILIPPGVYYFRPVELKSNICLNISAGARLVASPRRSDYFPIGYHHNEMGAVYSALYALDQKNITIKGHGVIDLSGQSFYYMDKPAKVTSVGPEITQEYLNEAPRTFDWRVNQPVFFHQCKNIHFDGLLITNAPCWTLSFNFCHTIKITNLTIENSLVIPNNDGMHFTGSKDILVTGCHITSGDDCIALTSITDWNTPCENVVITNCVLQSASKALSIGYMHSIVRNVLVENVIVKKSNRALVLMCHPNTGLVENISIANCILEGRSYGGNWWGNGEAIVIMATPQHIATYRDPLPEPRFETSIKNIFFSNITCIAERAVGIVASKPILGNIQLRDSCIEIVSEIRPSLKGNVLDLAPGPENYKIPAAGTGIVYKNAQLQIENVTNGNGGPVIINEIE